MASKGKGKAPEPFLHDVIKHVNGVPSVEPFSEGFNTNLSLMFETFRALTERSEALSSTQAELEAARRRARELERVASSSAELNQESTSLLERLVQVLGTQNRSQPTRSAELRDTEVFSGLKKDFSSWKESVLLKLNINADHYQTEQSEMALVFSLLNA
ncbi:hypothetical protein K3495_g8264 [Podosphaera aphanis]|nr:hypothetical protein K3495_g8264 [Podosphaera aphanis]